MRYLHSDIDTVERVEIIRDLRLGKFDAVSYTHLDVYKRQEKACVSLRRPFIFWRPKLDSNQRPPD